MPHRILSVVPYAVLGIIDAVCIGLISAAGMFDSAFLALTETDWNRLVGPHGFTVGLILAVIVLWATAMRREACETKRREAEEAARDKRHQDTIRMQRDNANDLKSITVESIKAQMITAEALKKLQESNDNNTDIIVELVGELKRRPCQKI